MNNPLADKYRDKMTEGKVAIATPLESLRAGDGYSLTLDGPLFFKGASIHPHGVYGMVYPWTREEHDDGSITFHPPEVKEPEPVMVEYEDLEPGDVFRWEGPVVFPGPRIKVANSHLFWNTTWTEALPTSGLAVGKAILMEPIPEDEI